MLKDLLCPSRIRYLWSFGFVVGLLIVVQVLSGLVLTIYFFRANPYDSVLYLCRETERGEMVRWIHARGVSVIFLAIYIHIFRGVCFNSYFLLPVWRTGIIIFILLILIAFLGYSLPWAQIRYWAATVITNLVTSIPVLGSKLVIALWGNYSVSLLTLNRFYTLHFLLPFVTLVLAVVHILALHLIHTKSPLQLKGDVLTFRPIYIIKDIWLLTLLLSLTIILAFFFPVAFMERDMFLESTPIRAPEHIVPEWYFLPFYAVLRGIPSKLGGVIAMLSVFVLLLALSLSGSPLDVKDRFVLSALFFCFILLFWIGGLPVVYPFDRLGKVAVGLFFVLFWFLIQKKY